MSESILGAFMAASSDGLNNIKRTLIERGNVNQTITSTEYQITNPFSYAPSRTLTTLSNYLFFQVAVSKVTVTPYVWGSSSPTADLLVWLGTENVSSIYKKSYTSTGSEIVELEDPFNLEGSGVYYAPLNTVCVFNARKIKMTFTWDIYAVELWLY